jgi:hypothetical protein
MQMRRKYAPPQNRKGQGAGLKGGASGSLAIVPARPRLNRRGI